MYDNNDPKAEVILKALCYLEENRGLSSTKEVSTWTTLVKAIREGYFYEDGRSIRINFGD